MFLNPEKLNFKKFNSAIFVFVSVLSAIFSYNSDGYFDFTLIISSLCLGLGGVFLIYIILVALEILGEVLSPLLRRILKWFHR